MEERGEKFLQNQFPEMAGIVAHQIWVECAALKYFLAVKQYTHCTGSGAEIAIAQVKNPIIHIKAIILHNH